MSRFSFYLFFLFICSSISISAQSFVLSFDDAPRAGAYLAGDVRATRLLEVLENAGVSEAVFYSNTREMKPGNVSPRLMRYSQAGHVIANHTANHPNLEEVSADDYIRDIQLADSVLKAYPTYKKWFRYPYLREAAGDKHKHHRVKEYIAEEGYRQGYVTVEIYDWYVESKFQQEVDRYTPEDLERFKKFYVKLLWDSLQFYETLAVEALGYSPVHVILLHENDINALFLGDFIELAKSKGFQPVKAQAAFADPLADAKWDFCDYSMRRLRTVVEAEGVSRENATPSFVRTEHLDEMMKTATLIK